MPIKFESELEITPIVANYNNPLDVRNFPAMFAPIAHHIMMEEFIPFVKANCGDANDDLRSQFDISICDSKDDVVEACRKIAPNRSDNDYWNLLSDLDKALASAWQIYFKNIYSNKPLIIGRVITHVKSFNGTYEEVVDTLKNTTMKKYNDLVRWAFTKWSWKVNSLPTITNENCEIFMDAIDIAEDKIRAAKENIPHISDLLKHAKSIGMKKFSREYNLPYFYSDGVETIKGYCEVIDFDGLVYDQVLIKKTDGENSINSVCLDISVNFYSKNTGEFSLARYNADNFKSLRKYRYYSSKRSRFVNDLLAAGFILFLQFQHTELENVEWIDIATYFDAMMKVIDNYNLKKDSSHFEEILRDCIAKSIKCSFDDYYESKTDSLLHRGIFYNKIQRLCC